jgi:hypothetical protein
MKTRTLLEAIGAALLLLPWYLPFIAPSNLPVYHHGLPVTNLIDGLLLDLLVVAVLAFGVLVAIQHLPAAVQRISLAMFAGFMLYRIADIAIKAWVVTPATRNFQYFARWNSVRNQCCIVVLLLSIALAYLCPRIAQPAVRAVRLVIAAFAFSALWALPQLLHVALVHAPVEVVASTHPPPSASSGPNRRIVWILYDGLSYDQTFDHLAPGMKFPNFDRLRNQSVSFSNLYPVGFFTDRIIPSLFLGRRIDQIRSTVDSHLWYKDESQNRWLAYDPNATLFALAQRNGWTAGVDGWYNPYCLILASTLNVCSWESQDIEIISSEAYGASEDKSGLANAAALWKEALARLTRRSENPRLVHVHAYQNVMARSRALIEDSQVRFVFLHFPIPHPVGIYDRHRHMLRPGGNYLDNLVLADDTMGELLREIDATPSAGQTTVIVTSDHSWRVPLWRGVDGWSAEEERASGGRFDERPVLLIHFPGQTSGDDVASTVPELLEHDIVAGMLLGKINNPEDLSAFLAQKGL